MAPNAWQVLQASSYWQQTEDAVLCLDLLPCMDEAAVIEWLGGRAAAAGRRRRPMFASEDLARKLPRRFAEQFWRQEACRQLGADQDAGLQDLSAAKLRRLAALLKSWEVTVVGTEGYPKAEVTCGGVSTAELSDETMECKTVPGLYFIGEAVDVTGWLGGYNFQWAWASGYAAGCAC
ncbi:unnamed protein product [Effrenium voratum]|nr:unnamed protein product [Effrenium voratum]